MKSGFLTAARIVLAIGSFLASLAASTLFFYFRSPPLDQKLSWEFSLQPLYHLEKIQGHLWALPSPAWVVNADASHPQGFAVDKAPQEYKIFCLGQSTTAGFPFSPRGGYPEWLGAYLRDLLPGIRAPVVNVGIGGAGSSTDLRLVREILPYRPNLVILYEGNNDDPSTFGWLNFGSSGWRRLLTMTVGKMLHWPPLRYLGWHPPALIGRWADEKFRANVDAMIALLKRNHVRVILVGQVNDRNLSADGKERSSDWHNQFLRERAGPGVAFLDTRRIFASRLRHGLRLLPGILLDSCHPSLFGQSLIATELCRKLWRLGWLAPPGQWRWKALKSAASYRKKLALTDAFLARAYDREARLIRANEPRYAGLIPEYVRRGELHRDRPVRRLVETAAPGLPAGK